MAGNVPFYDYGLRWHAEEVSLLAVAASSLFLFLLFPFLIPEHICLDVMFFFRQWLSRYR